ncbi:MAG TPA: lytic transglycosylase domain-containing protein [Chitinophagaceae bacterium]|nr:lytic transglycosylase domain-containing protein [Chitinophagaceae bacterium]
MKQVSFSGLVNFGTGLLFGVFVLSQLSFSPDDPNGHRDFNEWHAPVVPDKFEFAGEQVPLQVWDVRERFDRELLFNYYWQNNIFYLLKLANRYFPVIEARLKANGVPDDFKYLCIAESNLMPNATSSSGAVGFWQFLRGTAPQYQLEVNSQVDMRRELLASTDAACKYLKEAYSKFGSWTAAAAAFNCGQGGYQAQASIQRTHNYYDLLLPEETNRYIFRILAFKYIMENAEDLGFSLKPGDLYQPIRTRSVVVNETVPDLVQFAIAHGTNYKTLRLLNPWIRSRSLVVKGRSYVIQLPL